MAKGEGKAKVPHNPTQPTPTPGDPAPLSSIGPHTTPDWTIHPIPISSIDVGEQMLRHDPDSDDIIELAADIATHGLMQPIGVSRTGTRYQLRWGSRRLAAHHRLRRPIIYARIVTAGDVAEIIGDAARENLLRRDLTLAEEINAIRRLVADGKSPNQISDLVGKSRTWVNRRLAFDGLPITLRDHVLSGDLPISHAEALSLIEDPSTQSYLTTHCLQHKPSLPTLRATIEAIQATPSLAQAIEEGAQAAQPQTPQPTVRLDCHICLTPTTLSDLTIIRVCSTCATASAGAANNLENTNGPNTTPRP